MRAGRAESSSMIPISGACRLQRTRPGEPEPKPIGDISILPKGTLLLWLLQQTQPKLPTPGTGAKLKTAANGSKNLFSGGIAHERTHCCCVVFSYSFLPDGFCC